MEFTSAYQAVLLINGSAYFGHLSGYGGPRPVLTDVYYIVTQTNPETKQVTPVLVKRGKELHEPDRMYLNPAQILFVETVGPKSKVAQLIEQAALTIRTWQCGEPFGNHFPRFRLFCDNVTAVEPISHFFYSDRLKLQFWDYGQDGKPSLVLVHGGLDHARNWDWVARVLCEHYHVYALDLRGHGNSAWAPGATYSVSEHVLDLSALLDIIDDFPIRLIGHSLGGGIVLCYCGVYPARARKAVSIEGLGFPQEHRVHGPASERVRHWIETVRELEKRRPKSYPNLDTAMARMKEANPRLSDEVARHLTLHGTNWDSDGSLLWKFDNYARAISPHGHHMEDTVELFSQITCPALFFWGLESFLPLPENDPRYQAIAKRRLIKVPGAGHWVHHDQLDLFLRETTAFLAD